MKSIRFWLFIALLGIWACSTDDGSSSNDDDDNSVTFDRKAMLTNWADNLIIPAYEDFAVRLNTMQSAYAAFSTDANEANLTTLRTAWLEAYKSWQYVSMYEIGPAETANYRMQMNTYPTDTDAIDQFTTSGSYDLAAEANFDAKGFPALDYLLNGMAATNAEIIASFDTNTRNLTSDIIDDMIALTTTVVNGWKGTYRDEFVNNSGASATASTDRFVNDYIYYFEKYLRAGKMGIPIGAFTGTPAPQTLEAYYSPQNSKILFLAGLTASQDFFNGKHFGSSAKGESLASYLVALNSVKDGDELNEIINAQFDTARSYVSALGTFKDEIENNASPTDMLLAYDEVQRIIPLLKVDMVSAMSISIDYVDADGD